MLWMDGSSHIVPDLKFKLLTDRHHMLLFLLHLLNVYDKATVFIHVLDTLIVLKVPYLNVTLA